VARSVKSSFDVVVIGGGVKGSAIARDAVGRGLRVLVCEQADLGSSCVKSLARLGLASFYPEKDFSPEEARKAAQEWEILRRISPHLSPVLATRKNKGIQSLIRRLRRQVSPNAVLDTPLRTVLSGHRFVMASLRDAAERGAVVLPRTRFISAQRKDEYWSVAIAADPAGVTELLTARILVDTTGGASLPSGLKEGIAGPCSKLCGTLAIVQDIGDGLTSEIEETINDRFFSVPLEQGCRLLGLLSIEENERTLAVLLERARSVCSDDFEPETVLWHGQTVMTGHELPKGPVQELDNYSIHIETDNGRLPLFQINGGAVSAARRLAEDTVAEMAPYAKMIGKQWTHTSTLPGGDFQPALREALMAKLRVDYPFLTAKNVARLFDTYGTDCAQMMGNASCEADLGPRFGEELFGVEVDWLVEKEWAKTAEDIVWRRTRLGQDMTAQQVIALDEWMTSKAVVA